MPHRPRTSRRSLECPGGLRGTPWRLSVLPGAFRYSLAPSWHSLALQGAPRPLSAVLPGALVVLPGALALPWHSRDPSTLEAGADWLGNAELTHFLKPKHSDSRFFEASRVIFAGEFASENRCFTESSFLASKLSILKAREGDGKIKYKGPGDEVSRACLVSYL